MKYRIPELEKEYHELFRRLREEKRIYYVEIPMERGTIHLALYIRPDTRTQKLEFIGETNVDVKGVQTETDQRLCADTILKVLDGLHWKTSKGYCRTTSTDYYIRPDWKYWYAKK